MPENTTLLPLYGPHFPHLCNKNSSCFSYLTSQVRIKMPHIVGSSHLDARKATFCVNYALVCLCLPGSSIAFLTLFMLFTPAAGFTRRYMNVEHWEGK